MKAWLSEIVNNTNDKPYLEIALNSSRPNIQKDVDNVIRKCTILLNNWKYLETLEPCTKVLIGISKMEVDTSDGICSNADFNDLGLDLKYSIFRSWNSMVLSENSDEIVNQFLYPIDGPEEYDYESSNLFRNTKRKELLIHCLNCLNLVKIFLHNHQKG